MEARIICSSQVVGMIWSCGGGLQALGDGMPRGGSQPVARHRPRRDIPRSTGLSDTHNTIKTN